MKYLYISAPTLTFPEAIEQKEFTMSELGNAEHPVADWIGTVYRDYPNVLRPEEGVLHRAPQAMVVRVVSDAN